nr:TIGR00282 family metallophosphoesterase [uncultured Butyricicoccus sp.]
MKLLAVGDVVSKPGLETVRRLLRQVKKQHGIDFTIVNGENASGVGITPDQADDLFAAGADVVTLGNHVYNKRQIVPYLDECAYILRPANQAPQQPGRGWGIFDCAGRRLLVMNLIGRCEMAFGPDNPFLCADRILKEQKGKYDWVVCEFHAGATSEKLAMGFYLDGRCSAVYGTHTHVPTADARVNPKGTGYMTDIGMTGPVWSVLGIQPEQSIAMFRGDLTEPFRAASGQTALMGAVFEIDDKSGKCCSVTPVYETMG